VRRRTPASLADLLERPDEYQAFAKFYGSSPQQDIQSQQFQNNLETLMGPVPHSVPRGVGPVAVTTGGEQSIDSLVRGLAGMDAPESAPHSSPSEVAMLPMGTAEQQDMQAPLPPAQPMGLAPHQALADGGHFDSGVAPGAPGITGGTAQAPQEAPAWQQEAQAMRQAMAVARHPQAPQRAQTLSPGDWLARLLLLR
jgi:hypothetical protein